MKTIKNLLTGTMTALVLILTVGNTFAQTSNANVKTQVKVEQKASTAKAQKGNPACEVKGGQISLTVVEDDFAPIRGNGLHKKRPSRKGLHCKRAVSKNSGEGDIVVKKKGHKRKPSKQGCYFGQSY